MLDSLFSVPENGLCSDILGAQHEAVSILWGSSVKRYLREDIVRVRIWENKPHSSATVSPSEPEFPSAMSVILTVGISDDCRRRVIKMFQQ